MKKRGEGSEKVREKDKGWIERSGEKGGRKDRRTGERWMNDSERQ